MLNDNIIGRQAAAYEMDRWYGVSIIIRPTCRERYAAEFTRPPSYRHLRTSIRFYRHHHHRADAMSQEIILDVCRNSQYRDIYRRYRGIILPCVADCTIIFSISIIGDSGHWPAHDGVAPAAIPRHRDHGRCSRSSWLPSAKSPWFSVPARYYSGGLIIDEILLGDNSRTYGR